MVLSSVVAREDSDRPGSIGMGSELGGRGLGSGLGGPGEVHWQ